MSRLPHSSPRPPCSAERGLRTVAYGFLTRGEMPLWHLWEEYFHSCAAGARGVRGLDVGGCPAVPIFHAQDLTKHDLIRRRTADFNGYVLPPNETIQGTPRFSWIMVAMMLHIYRTLDRVVAPNGCQPSWVHIASERDVPVVACPTVHRELAAHPRVSRVQHMPQFPAKHSQWVTLWAAHARQIAGTPEHESMLEQYWLPRFSNGASVIRVEIGGQDWMVHSAPDEVVLGWELIHRSDGPRASVLGGLTYISWNRTAPSRHCSTVDNSNGSPCAYVNREAAAAACGFARRQSKMFARKIGDGSEESSKQVMGAISNCIGFFHSTVLASSKRPFVPPTEDTTSQSCSLLIVASVSNRTNITLHARNLKKFGPEWKCVMLTHSLRTDFPERCDVIRHYNTFWGQILHMSLGQISKYGCGTKLLMLDDVDILDLNVPRLQTFASQHRLDVASPTVRGATHPWMQDATDANGRNETDAGAFQAKLSMLPHSQFVEIYVALLTPLAWLTFSKLLDLMPNGKGWGYDICLGRHLASGVDTSQLVLLTRSRELLHATGELIAPLKRELAELRRMCTTEWFTKFQPARSLLQTPLQRLALSSTPRL
jgi:hypothetical protein